MHARVLKVGAKLQSDKKVDPNESHESDEEEALPPRLKSSRRNIWLLITTLPVVVVLFFLPIQEEMEQAVKGGERARFEERVSILAQHPIDFVVHASHHQRFTLPFKSHTPAKGTSSSSAIASCVRLFGFNQTLNAADANLRRIALPRIKHVRIVGERNSGVHTLKSDLSKVLRNVTVDIGLTRWGYWFQDAALLDARELKPEETLVIHISLEPYEWFARMQVNPIHAPYHKKPTGSHVNWTTTTFFKRPWTCQRPEWDDPRPAQGHCQYKFPYDSVMPCLPGKNTGPKANKLYPIYEMHPHRHVPFPTIVHLRTAKTLNFLNISSWMPHVVHVRSDDVAHLSGVNSFVSALLDRYRLSIACEVHKRDPVRYSSTASSSAEEISWHDNPPEHLTMWQVKFITCNLDWELESQLGFSPKEKINEVCPHGSITSHKHGDSASEKSDSKDYWKQFVGRITTFGRR